MLTSSSNGLQRRYPRHLLAGCCSLSRDLLPVPEFDQALLGPGTCWGEVYLESVACLLVCGYPALPGYSGGALLSG